MRVLLTIFLQVICLVTLVSQRTYSQVYADNRLVWMAEKYNAISKIVGKSDTIEIEHTGDSLRFFFRGEEMNDVSDSTRYFHIETGEISVGSSKFHEGLGIHATTQLTDGIAWQVNFNRIVREMSYEESFSSYHLKDGVMIGEYGEYTIDGLPKTLGHYVQIDSSWSKVSWEVNPETKEWAEYTLSYEKFPKRSGVWQYFISGKLARTEVYGN